MAGSIAGGLSRTVAAPLETVRVRLMTGAATGTGSMASPSILGMLRDIAKHEGVRALWKGNAAVVARRMRDAADEVCEHDSGPPE